MNSPLPLREKIALLGIPEIKHHIFLCCDQTNPKCCEKETGIESWEYLKKRIVELSLDHHGVYRSKANCLRVCTQGSIMVIYPEGIWYHSCTPLVIEQILQKHILQGQIVDEFFLARSGSEESKK